jgi:hypothetical protein
MRRALFTALDLYRKASRLALRVRGLTPESHAERRVVSGRAWEEFCDALKSAGAAVSGAGAPLDPLTQAEGYRYLSRLTRAGLEAFLEHADPAAPQLRRLVHETVKLGADNPDNHYLNATISGAYEYRLSGTRGSVHFLHFATQKGGYGAGGDMPPTGALDSGVLDVRADGTFEIAVSCAPRPGNWLPMEPETGLLIVRQTFLDKAREVPAQIAIERVGGDVRPAPLSPRALDDGLRATASFVAGASLLFAKWVRDFQAHVNELPRFDPARSTAAGGDPNIAYYHSAWRLGPGEALVVEVTPPPCELWNFQINNHWMESLDYRFHTVHVNKHTAVMEDDGSVRVVVAHVDPGLPNWLDTAGHGHGTMCWRWTKAASHPTPRTRVVPLADLVREARARRGQ